MTPDTLQSPALSAVQKAPPPNIQTTISTKLFLALGLLTLTAVVAGLVSILMLNRFQNSFDSLTLNELPKLKDTAQISQLSATVTDRGPSLIISPNTWTRLNIIGQLNDDSRWLEEVLARVPQSDLSKNRKADLLGLKNLLIDSYSTLNTLTENRIIYAERLDEIDQEIIQIQQDLVALQFGTNLPDGNFSPSGPLQQWTETIHTIIFRLLYVRNVQHIAPLLRQQKFVQGRLTGIRRDMEFLPKTTRLEADDLLTRLESITTARASLFNMLRKDLIANDHINATLRRGRTIAERFVSSAGSATYDIHKTIDRANEKTRQSMEFTFQAMIALTVISMLIALITYLYISRTVISRVNVLRRSMVSQAEGDHKAIDTSGNDEITQMAQSLQYLVDALHSRELGLMHAKEEAEHASTAKTRFLAAASHDLRQPLQALNLFVFSLEKKETNPEKREIIDLIRASLDSLKELLNTLLDISKLEAGVVQPRIKSFPLGPMIERVKGDMAPVAIDKNLNLISIASSLSVNSDPALLETVVRNLVDNAIKYTDTGKVLVGCRRHGQHVRLQVIDTGPGIPSDQKDLIFQDFYQIDNEARNRTQGLGLGLSIVKRMTDVLGCTMGCTSIPGRGSCFWIEVPLSDDVKSTSFARPSLPHAQTDAQGHRTAHIVVIEDDPQILNGLMTVLQQSGYTTQGFQGVPNDAQSYGFKSAFSRDASTPDLVIADYRLEGNTTGQEAINLVFDALGRTIPAIIITGDTAPERLREAKKSGFPILHKPIQPEDLLSIIQKTLKN